MLKILITTGIALVVSTIFGAAVGRNLMLIMYIPMNTILPLLIMVLMYDYLMNRVQPGITMGIFVFLATAAIFFTVMFSLDILFFNSSTGVHELFRKDYLGWILILAPSVIVVPLCHRKLGR